ncbi:MAG: DUF885 family protein, partial [Planctomycetota bacterium]
SRSQAIEYMLANSALTKQNVAKEVDRYIAWPGQATAYKIGEMLIRRMRAKAEKELGAKFDLRAFHDTVLEEGSIPLPLLEARLNAWIASVLAAGSGSSTLLLQDLEGDDDVVLVPAHGAHDVELARCSARLRGRDAAVGLELVGSKP